MLNEFIKAARGKKWVTAIANHSSLPIEIIRRYPTLPQDYTEFMTNIDVCAASDRMTWFVTASVIREPSEVRWNEIELVQLQAAAADNDEAWLKEITHFWDEHVPLVLSVRSDYAYLALRLTQNDSAIVFAREPTFDETYEVCDTFTELLRTFVQGDELWDKL